MDTMNELDALLAGIDPDIANSVIDAAKANKSNSMSETKKSGDSKGPNIYEDDYTPVGPDIANLNRFDRTFTILSSGVVPEDVVAFIVKLLPITKNMKFTLRTWGYNDDLLLKAVMQNKEQVYKIDHYLPMKKYHDAWLEDAKLNYPTKKAIQMAAFYNTVFNKRKEDGNLLLPGFVRLSISRNNHVLLGEDLDRPLSCIVCYTSCGSDSKYNVNYATSGYLTYYFEVGHVLGIPIFNLGKPDAKNRLLQFLNTYK